MQQKQNTGAAFRSAVVVVLMMGAAAVVLAHHSNSMFLVNKETTLEGTITAVALANPHSAFFLDAKPVDEPDPPVKNWSVEAPNPRTLERLGWVRNTVKPGDKVRVTGFARRDGRAQLLFVEMTSADGKGYHFVDTESRGGDAQLRPGDVRKGN